jgi:hypothetical protein
MRSAVTPATSAQVAESILSPNSIDAIPAAQHSPEPSNTDLVPADIGTRPDIWRK